MQLVALHQALHETLSREDYEQAAWLRDQIKALTEGKDHQSDHQSVHVGVHQSAYVP